MIIQYCTSNDAKFAEASLILNTQTIKNQGITITKTHLFLDELQGTSQEIAAHKAMQACRELKSPCIVDDVSLYCPCLGGLPGPYIREFLTKLGDKKLAELIAFFDDPSCTVVCTIAFQEHIDSPCHFFEGTVTGKIVAPRGSRTCGKTSWNAIVEPEGYVQTYAEISLEEMSKISPRSKALTAFKNYLQEHIDL